MQQLTCKMVWSFSFHSQKSLNFKRSPGGKVLKICEKSVPKTVWKSVRKCRNDFALQLLPFSFALNTGVPREKARN